MTVKTILCDLDGVLIWHHPTDPSQDWRRELVSRGMLEIWEAFQASPDWQKCLRDRSMNTRFSFLNYLIRKGYPPNSAAQAVIDVWLEKNCETCMPALQKIFEWEERGFEFAVASNQDGTRLPYIDLWLQENGLSRFRRFISCDLSFAKPDKDYFLHIQEELGRDPEELLLIDDRQENIQAAQQAGWSAFWVDESYRLRPEKWKSAVLSSVV